MLLNHELNVLKDTFGLNSKEHKGIKLEKSNNKKSSQKLSKKTRADIIVPEILRTEVNFLKYPFFDLARNSKRDKIEIVETIKADDGEAKIYWKVKRPLEDTFPGVFDKNLYRAVEQIINNLPRPIVNPIRLGSLRELCELMGISKGKGTKMVRNALVRMVQTNIEAKGTFVLKENKKKRQIDRIFHIYEEVIFTGQDMPDNSKADSVYLFLGNFYLQNINARYVIPLDWRYYLSLDDNITKRMYEYLSLCFFAVLEHNNEHVSIKYSKLCNFFPLVRQKTKQRAGDQLSSAHKALTQTGYFDRKPEWVSTDGINDWVIYYWPGKRAKDEWVKNKGKKSTQETDAPIQIAELTKTNLLAIDKEALVEELIKKGISGKSAHKLVIDNPDRIKPQINYFNFLEKHHPERFNKNPAGFLRKSIEENYSPPADYVSPKEQEQKKKQRDEFKKQQEWQNKIDGYKKWVETSPEHKIYWSIEKWKKEYRKKHSRLPSIEEIKNKEKELINELPTDEEKQIEIFGKVIYKGKTLELFKDN